MLVIRYELEDGKYYFQDAPFNATGNELRERERPIRDRAEQLGNPVVQARWINWPTEEYEQLSPEQRVDALLDGTDRGTKSRGG